MVRSEKLKESAEVVPPPYRFGRKLKQAKDEKQPLIAKPRFDPTAPVLHLGHEVRKQLYERLLLLPQ